MTNLLPEITPLSVRDGLLPPEAYFPNVLGLDYRRGISDTQMIAAIDAWIRRILVPFENSQVQLIDAGRQASVDALVLAVNTALTNQAAGVNANVQNVLEQVIAASIVLSDPVMLGVFESTGSGSVAWLNDNLKYLKVVTNARNSGSGMFEVDDFGAVGDGVALDHAHIDAAITAAHAAYLTTGALQRVHLSPKAYLVEARPWLDANGQYRGVTCIQMLDGVILCGEGRIKVRSGAYGPGAPFAVIRGTFEGLSDATIDGITVDGNRAGNIVSDQCSNICMTAKTNVTVKNTRQYSANGQGIQLVGDYDTGPAYNLVIEDNYVNDASNIGIQVAQFSKLRIHNNYVGYTANSVDVYGDHGGSEVHGGDFVISDNMLTNGAGGIFLETVASGVVTGNMVTNMNESGVHVNRINGEPNAIKIANNVFNGCVIGGVFTGDTGSVVFQGNTVHGASQAGVALGGNSQTRVGSVKILDNEINTSPANGAPLINIIDGTNQAAFIVARGNTTQNQDRSHDIHNGAASSPGTVLHPFNEF